MDTSIRGELAQRVADHVPAMLAYWSAQQICLFANDAYYDWFGKSKEEVLGSSMKDLLGPLYPLNLPHILKALEGHVQVFERDIPKQNGEIRHSIATYTPDIVDGQVLGFFVHVADVTLLKLLERELEAAKAEAEKLATHDYLTGLPNRVLLEDRIVQGISNAKRRNEKFAVISLDLDHFKEVNDNFGHEVGDRLLIEISSRIKHSIRESDTIVRMGGDEFILLSPELDFIHQLA